MKLKELLKDIYQKSYPDKFQDLDISDISSDSRMIKKNSLFTALQGKDRNGSDFINDAIRNGAKVIARKDIIFEAPNDDMCVLLVSDPKDFLWRISERFYNSPSKKLSVVGVTGTNGKTTICYLLESIINYASKTCGVIGTVNHRIGKKTITAKNTTPGIIDIQKLLAEMVEGGFEYCVMEVSSHALDQQRVKPIHFSSAVFTNLTGDHLDYHGTMENYFVAKSLLFRHLSKDAYAIINIDDKYGKELAAMTDAQVVTYGLCAEADVYAFDIETNSLGSSFKLCIQDYRIDIKTSLIGEHNIYNILAAVTACNLQGIRIKDIAGGIKRLEYVPGRLEPINCGQDFGVFVDYAHTEDALKNVLTTLKKIVEKNIIVVFGCGGNRDKTKRVLMGKVANNLADITIITNDNPRDEDPQAIIDSIASGFDNKNYSVVLDRKEAIFSALSQADKGDIVLIAGKGHEDYQIIKDKTIHFDDREAVREYFECS